MFLFPFPPHISLTSETGALTTGAETAAQVPLGHAKGTNRAWFLGALKGVTSRTVMPVRPRLMEKQPL